MPELLALFQFNDQGWGDELATGLLVTVLLALCTLPLGLLIGLLIAGAKLSSFRPLRFFGSTYTTALRGVPELLTLFLIYNGLQLLINRLALLFDPEAQVELSPFAAGTIALAMVFGSYAAEVFRGAFLSVDRGQIEAGQAAGMPRFLVFHRILLPQAWRIALPGLGNLWLIMLKDTALVSVIALDELLRKTNIAVSVTKQPFVFYLVACLLYLALTLLSGRIYQRLEAGASRGVRRA